MYGPAQRRLLVWELAEQFLNGEQEVWLQGTGDESRDYLYVDDFAAAVRCDAHILLDGIYSLDLGNPVIDPNRVKQFDKR